MVEQKNMVKREETPETIRDEVQYIVNSLNEFLEKESETAIELFSFKTRNKVSDEFGENGKIYAGYDNRISTLGVINSILDILHIPRVAKVTDENDKLLGFTIYKK